MIKRRTVAREWPDEGSPRVLRGAILDGQYATRVSIVSSREVFW